MTKLRISPDVLLPDSTATSTIAVLGGKGMGKTNLDAVIAEELYAAKDRFCWVDPIGVAWSLQHGATRTEPGLEVLVLGGVHGDIAIEPTAGAIVADLVVDHDVSVVIDISRRPNGTLWTHGEQIRFVTDFMTRLYQRQGERRRRLHVIFDEIGRFAPQSIPSGAIDIAKCLGALEQVMELGRNVGIGMTISTQRSARVSKSLLELADALFAFRTVGPLSVKAITDWLSEKVDKKQVGVIVDEVRSLSVGSALLVSPGWLQLERIVAVRKRVTFDASATPTGKGSRAPGKARKPDLAKYRELMAATIEKAVADDPALLRKQLAERDRKIKALEAVATREQFIHTKAIQAAEAATRTETKRVDVPVLKKGELARLERVLKSFDSLTSRFSGIEHDMGEAVRPVYAAIQQVLAASSAAATTSGDVAAAAVRADRAPIPKAEHDQGARPLAGAGNRNNSGSRDGLMADRHFRDARTTRGGSSVGSERGHTGTDVAGSTPAPRSEGGAPKRYLQKVLDAIGSLHALGYERPTLLQVATWSKMSLRGGAFRGYLRELAAAGLVEKDETVAWLTPAGEAAAHPNSAVTTADLHALAHAIARPYLHKVLDPLLNAYPVSLEIAELAAQAGMSLEGGAFRGYVRELRAFGFATQSGDTVRAADVLFLEAA